MPSFCCFFHPSKDFSEKSLQDVCKVCAKPFSFPLDNPPKTIGKSTVVRKLGRGFYGATYVVKQPPFGNLAVIKIVPKPLYKFFKKNFKEECLTHNKLSKESEHLVAIRDMGSEVITLGGEQIDCYTAELDFIAGPTLKEFIKKEKRPPAFTIAQIAMDLYSLLSELGLKGVYHNDLHTSNLIVQRLADHQKRMDAVDDNIRVKAIDLGSVSDESKSNYPEKRPGDIRWVVSHIRLLLDKLLRNPTEVPELDHRLASILEEHCSILDHPSQNARIPSFDELRKEIYVAVTERVVSPWQQPLDLQKFGWGYNAQTIRSWHVPSLLEDSNGEWLNKITSPGPLILTGMRGCGKTMLLRSATFHARASAHKVNESKSVLLKRIKGDQFLGIYTSVNKLFGTPKKCYEKLFIAYARESLQTIRHLSDLTDDTVNKPVLFTKKYGVIAEVVATWLTETKKLQTLSSWGSIDRALLDLQLKLNDPKSAISLNGHPSEAFESLASALKAVGPMWSDKYVLFLLDDVSTRYLTGTVVRKVVSELLFKSEVCAFKFTTEAQTLELVIRTPGQNAPAWEGRDYEIFDLGSEVNQRFSAKGKSGGKYFLDSILRKRADHYPGHPNCSPSGVLGDTSLESIAYSIGRSGSKSGDKKKIYHGISALAGICVGDIGDAVKLYEEMLSRHRGKDYPIPDNTQSECFQNFCSRRLYQLSKRNADFKSYALGFAEASHGLLDVSFKAVSKGRTQRLRQYTKIYVGVTAGDKLKQQEKLRELIDAGVFVFEGGTQTPRTKTKHSDPLTQFILSYRKLYGLSSYIPIADRDRFELSGSKLEELLANPDHCKQILLDSLRSSKKTKQQSTKKPPVQDLIAIQERQRVERTGHDGNQLNFRFMPSKPSAGGSKKAEEPKAKGYLRRYLPTVSDGDIDSIDSSAYSECILGLGFEERTLMSAERILKDRNFKSIKLVSYPEKGHSSEIIKLARRSSKNVKILKYADFIKVPSIRFLGRPLIDVSGLATPAIFHIVRGALQNQGGAAIVHTYAQKHYPSNEDIEKVLTADKSQDIYHLLDQMGHIFTGEKRPYSTRNLLGTFSDELKDRALCCFSSAKHERLLRLLELRDYDHIEIEVPSSETPRSKLAQMAAEVIARNFVNTYLHHRDFDNLADSIDWLNICYEKLFIEQGLSMEVGLTGTKIQAVATAAVSCVFRYAGVWHIYPKSFDTHRFTEGVGKSIVQYLTLPNLHE